MKIKYAVLSVLILVSLNGYAQSVKILFDATKAETASNADWVVDADLNNLGYSPGAVVGGGNESNAQQIPTLSQSGITASTPETYWKGALSNWGIDCVNQNYIVETLPYNGQITYGNSNNAQDLSNYKVFIVCEPNIIFSSAEKTAILNFVQNGGGLFMVSDHDVSDRNNDGKDSPHIWNDLMSNNTVQTNPFGMTFDYANFSQTTSNIPSLPTDSILHGTAGNVTQVKWSGGTTLTLNSAQNSTVKGVIYKTSSTFGNTNVMCAYARYGSGKVAAIGDSSPCDDGSGDSNDNLFNGYTGDANGNHRKLLMNITIWLATSTVTGPPTANFSANPVSLCIGQTTIFTNSSSGGITNFAWNFGAGATPATASTIGPHSVSYSTSGNKTISLTVTGTGGSNTLTKTNYINVASNCQTLDAGVLALLSPASVSCPVQNQPLQVRIKNYGGNILDFSVNHMDVNLQVADPLSVIQSFTKTLSSGTLSAGATLDVTMNSTYDLDLPGNYLINANTVLLNDANTSNDAMAQVTITVGPFQSDYTVVSESMGTVSSTTTIATHESNNGFDNDNLTMSGTADVRATQSSLNTYTGASGGANVFFTNTVGRYFLISGINTSSFTNLQLSLGIYKTGASPDLLVEVSADGNTYTPLTFSAFSINTWTYDTLSGVIPSASNLRLRFTQNSSTVQYRIDDILLTNGGGLPTITTQSATTFCQGGSALLNASTATTYLWSNGMTTQNITVAVSGDYSVTETNANGCIATSSAIAITVNPSYNIPVNASICPGSTYTLPNGQVVSNAGVYTTTLQTADGCDSVYVTTLSVINVNDNNLCTTDACNTSTGVVTHTPVNTSDNNACTTDACNSQSGAITHTAISIDDNNPCTADACNTTSGAITHSAINTDDSNPCTTDGCNSASGIFHTPVNTSDGNACTTDACNSQTGAITHTFFNIDDGNACTTDACNSSSGNVTHDALNPDDSNPCTIDGCNSATGIYHNPVNTDDGDACTTDGCNSLSGIFHTSLNTDDNDVCTIDGCDSVTGVFHSSVNTDDGDACTTDGCNSLSGIFHASVNTDDNDVCTIDGCDSVTGIFHSSVNTDDGDACTTDGCNSVTGVFHNLLSSDDGNACTTDGCNSSTGIFHDAVNTNDGNACTTDACDSNNGFISHVSVNIDDRNACTLDACNSINGIITHTPIPCGIDFYSNIFLEAFYIGGGVMNNTLYTTGISANPLHTDLITLGVYDASPPHNLVDKQTDTLYTNGNVHVRFSGAVVPNNSYYIKVTHRNHVSIWSASPVLFTSSTTYIFSDAANKAFSDIQTYTHVIPGAASGDGFGFALYCGDIWDGVNPGSGEQDGSVDATDFLDLDPHIQNGDGGYIVSDINGDGSVDATDFLWLDPNVQNGIGSATP